MVDEEDIELVRTGYSAFVAGDKEWLNEHLHVNVVWHAAGKGSRAGEYRGREEVLASFAISSRPCTSRTGGSVERSSRRYSRLSSLARVRIRH
jgi:ketosteroid isomerase-like protein